jgi:hypothetical protein
MILYIYGISCPVSRILEVLQDILRTDFLAFWTILWYKSPNTHTLKRRFFCLARVPLTIDGKPNLDALRNYS